MEEKLVAGEKDVFLVTSGDLRVAANQVCWPAQRELEERLTAAFAEQGFRLVRAHAYDEVEGHGFISSQRMGMDVFMRIPKGVRLVFATAAWQYSHHVLPGLRSHEGPMLTVANWSGQWPGLVGLLNLNGSLTKAGVEFSSIWSRDFTDAFFRDGVVEWLKDGTISHDVSQVHVLEAGRIPAESAALGQRLAEELKHRKAILGIFDEGCMGMYNAIVDDELLNPAGIYKERLSQSALVAKMRTVAEDEAAAVYQWLVEKGVTLKLGKDPATELTLAQVLEQCRMYIAAVRIANEFGCDAIGIQYQQGLKDMAAASDLVEGLLNNAERPPVFAEGTQTELYAGGPLVHFNEVDECAGVDGLVTNRCWSALGIDPSTTLHDVRWGEHYKGEGLDEFVWLLQISGAAPANHFVGGYAGATSERQPAMYFPLGGGSLKGVSRPGEIVWSRVFVEGGALHVDLGRGTVVSLPTAETERRWRETTYQWPIMNAVFHGVSRDQFMARHRANHVNVAYAPTAEMADKALATKAAMMSALGLTVHLCGETAIR
ncbi:fucose isomerase [Granulicella sp. dw_53]|uniref:fucose isomerase n=1 Tax=Granulicella sp. dw_53 TaxID=2719792 RepID=UPI001BD204FF|nr:fucose isomerase [Granulicella sp. dw_53]